MSAVRRCRSTSTVSTIWNHRLPASKVESVPAPDFERYDERFDPSTGQGEVGAPSERS